MNIRLLFATLLALALRTAAYSRAPDEAKLDQYFDRLAEKNKAMGSLTIAREGQVVNSPAIGYAQIDRTTKKPLTLTSCFPIATIG